MIVMNLYVRHAAYNVNVIFWYNVVSVQIMRHRLHCTVYSTDDES